MKNTASGRLWHPSPDIDSRCTPAYFAPRIAGQPQIQLVRMPESPLTQYSNPSGPPPHGAGSGVATHHTLTPECM